MKTPIATPIVSRDAVDTGDRLHLGPRRALFLDRDGVINVNYGYVHTPEQTDWVPGIFELAREARKAGFAIVVVTNQAGIARGYYDVAEFERYTRWMHACFEREGAPLLATYYCPHHADAGIGDWRVTCGCRKPMPGMLLAAIDDWSIDPAHSLLIGDQPSDIDAAKRAGVPKTFLVRDGALDEATYWFASQAAG